MRIQIRHFKNYKYLQFLILTVFSFVFPFYISETNMLNLSFVIVEIPLIILVILCINNKRLKRDKTFICLLLIYVIFFLYVDIAYLDCYWALIYKTFSFFLLWNIETLEKQKLGTIRGFSEEFTDSIIIIFSFTVVLSLVANIIGIDAVFLDLQSFHIRSSNSGVFLDKRLTWVFMHKSTYGLLLILGLALLMKRKNFPYRKIFIILYFIAGIRVNSMVSIVGLCMVMFAYFLETKSMNRKKFIKLLIVIVVGAIVAGVIYFIVALERNLSSLGDRAYIWGIYGESLRQYPYGLGKDFFTQKFWLPEAGRYINNFHNVIFNEMIHYSIPVGLLFTAMIFYYPIKYIVKNKCKMKNIVLLVGIMLPTFFDQALNDLIFPIFLIMIKLCFSNYNECFSTKENIKF